MRRGGLGDDVVADIPVTNPPLYHGLCLTSIASSANAVWVTVAGDLSQSYTDVQTPC